MGSPIASMLGRKDPPRLVGVVTTGALASATINFVTIGHASQVVTSTASACYRLV